MKKQIIFFLLFGALLGGCAGYQTRGGTKVRPLFYASNEYGGKPSYFIGVLFGETNDVDKTAWEPIMSGDGRGRSGKSGRGGCQGGSCSSR